LASTSARPASASALRMIASAMSGPNVAVS
jgi:hypothetical protein